MADEQQDQQDLQQYFDNLNKEIQEEEDDENGDVVLTIETQMDDDDKDEDADNNGTIIMDADGNYYFQTSDKMVEVKPMKKESPMKKVPATVVTPGNIRKMPSKTDNKRKQTFDSTPSKSLKQIKLEDCFKKIKKDETETEKATIVSQAEVSELIIPMANETLPSENEENIEEIYDFDESEEDPDDPATEEIIDDGSKNIVKLIDYESKGVVKPIDQVGKTAGKTVKRSKSTTDNSSSFTCMLCPYETNKKFLLSRHLKTHSDDRPFKCSVCERGFKTNASLMNHVNTHLGNKPHACKDCEKTFTTSGELVRHVRYRHTHVKPHKCTECDYSSVEMSKLRRHMRCHTGERPYQCPHCTYASPDTFKLKRHLRTHTGEKPYECDICQARFTQSNSLKYHRLIHSVNDKPVFQCQLCPTTCGRKTDLRLHIKKLHSSDNPIVCKRCGKELPDRYSYKMHVKTHEGEKCYRCTYCPYASITQRHLESHMLIHTDTKPFICDICHTTFRQKQLLTRHIKVYHTADYERPQPRKKDHKCPHCDKSFAFNGNLIRHMEAHDPASHVSEEKQKLRIGRMKRVLADGRVVTYDRYNSHKGPTSSMHSGDDDNIAEETEEQLEEEREVYEEEQEEEEYEEEYNELENIQYIYRDIEGNDEYEVDDQANELEGGSIITDKKDYIEIKMENSNLKRSNSSQPQLTHLKNVAVKKENDGSEFVALEVDDGNGYMVIEVLPDDDDDIDDDIEKHEEQEPKLEKVSNINNRNDKKSSKKSTVINPSDCFGFEVDEDEDDFPVGAEASELMQLIEQD